MIPGKHRLEDRPAVATDAGRRVASRVYGKLRPFTVGGVRKTGLNVCGGQVRKVPQNLLLRHAGREVLEHIANSHAHASNTWLAATLPRFYGDDVPIIHGAIFRVIVATRLYATPGRPNTTLPLDSESPDGPHLSQLKSRAEGATA